MFNIKNIAIGVLVLLLLAIGIWYWQKREPAPPQEEPAGVGAQIFEKAQNPVADKVPETNPFRADLNPFKKETNPLKAIYTNPFGE
ncbi:MAG: hypothetical protein HYW91_01295 [Candidatus Sungbacteria bacterium]|nr:hypothetical protein [Candidatus Sungbacteria bacterium]